MSTRQGVFGDYMRKKKAGFVLVNALPCDEKRVGYKLKEIGETYLLNDSGYRFIVQSEAYDRDDLGENVTMKIRRIPGVIDTKTMF
ncbi:MAG: Lrp/AsnC family transcriptional regulator [Candidatus Aenigmarchaeota archaeon]|nr:Lrp/AsnC family transcriptional regulator [Candidatus Aenigmarchaeota archaeon]